MSSTFVVSSIRRRSFDIYCAALAPCRRRAAHVSFFFFTIPTRPPDQRALFINRPPRPAFFFQVPVQETSRHVWIALADRHRTAVRHVSTTTIIIIIILRDAICGLYRVARRHGHFRFSTPHALARFFFPLTNRPLYGGCGQRGLDSV